VATLRETARYLQMSATTVERWARSGRIPSTVTPDGARTFDRASLAAIIPTTHIPTDADEHRWDY
nr:helix-turn-helix domain-containing protein [Actinomycetota bacterium]